MFFSHIAGQNTLKSKLTELIRIGRMPHASLIIGSEGNGGLPLALAISSYMVCENRTDTDSCGNCPSCVKSFKGIHPDIHYTFPTIRSDKQKSPPVSADYMKEWRKAMEDMPYMNANDWLESLDAENKQGNITSSECREIIRQLSLKSFESAQKVQIIWLAEYLKETGNTLLKILEEPPVGTYFILISEQYEGILSTILSRTQIFKLEIPGDDEVSEALMTSFELDKSSALQIARISEGNLNQALKMAAGAENGMEEWMLEWFTLCSKLYRSDDHSLGKQLVSWVEKVDKSGREQQKLLIRYALFFLRECGLLKSGFKQTKLSNEELNLANSMFPVLHPEVLEKLLQSLNYLFLLIERNGYAKIHFVSFSYRISAILSGVEVEELA